MAANVERARDAGATTPTAGPTLRTSTVDWIAREAFALLAVAVYVAVVVRFLPGTLGEDTWSALVAGREVADHGLPARDELFAWTQGQASTDPRWLAHLLLYALAAAGGVKLALLGSAAAVVAALVAAMVFARGSGASPRSVLLVAFVPLLTAPWAFQARAQALTYPLFVCTLGLLLRHARDQSPAVLLVLPLLVVWANVHESAVLGAALVTSYGLLQLARALRRTPGSATLPALALLVAAPVCIFVSPYGPALIDEYRLAFAERSLDVLVAEGRPPTPAIVTVPFYVAAFAAVALIARHGRALPTFGGVALALSLAVALTSYRDMVWFGLTALLVLPAAVERALGRSTATNRSLNATLGTVGAAVCLAAATFAFARPPDEYTRDWSFRGAETVARELARDPSARVFADGRQADFLLWTNAELRGRIAFGARFELLGPEQVGILVAFRELAGDHWHAPALGHRFVVLSPPLSGTHVTPLLERVAATVAYEDARFVLLAQPRFGGVG